MGSILELPEGLYVHPSTLNPVCLGTASGFVSLGGRRARFRV